MVDKELIIRYINSQGLTYVKYYELRKLIQKSNEILLLTETHLKCDKFKADDDIIGIHKIREKNDKKGGGLSLLYNKKIKEIEIEEKNINHSDLLLISMEFKKSKMKIDILLVYFSVINKKEDKERNKRIQECIENQLEKSENIILIGDYNGHIKEIGTQKENINGKTMKSIIDRHNLFLINTSDKCTGKVTWQRNEQKSTIDYVAINEKLIEKIDKMVIDEERNIFDLSDHNLIELHIKTELEKKNEEK